MSKKANPTIVGGFVVGAIFLAVSGIFIFNKGPSGPVYECVAYFDGSVGGLERGAAVRFRGVKVGEVANIEAISDGDDIRIPVFIDLIGGRVKARNPDEPGPFRDPKDAITHLIRVKGLRAQLATESLVTGKLYVALDFHPTTTVRLVKKAADGHDDLVEVPTIPSRAEQIMEKIEALELGEFVKKMSTLVEHVDELVTAPAVSSSLKNLDALLVDLRKLSTSVEAQVEPLSGTAQDALTEYTDLAKELRSKLDPVTDGLLATLAEATATLTTFKATLDPGSELRYKTSQVLEEFSQAARSLRTFTDYLERHPEALLRGKK